MISIKTQDEINSMREGGKMLAQVLAHLEKNTVVGSTPKDMSRLAAEKLKLLGGKPAFLGYHGYPDVICISVNDQVQHSIPSDKPYKDGDIVNYDFGVLHKGMITDGGITVGVGKISQRVQQLISGTKEALYAGLDVIRDGCHVGNVSSTIEMVLRKYNLGIVRELVGHGVGYKLHESPEIPNYGARGNGPILKAGNTVAIEPITTLGGDAIKNDPDGWTLWTADGSWSAQFEHTVLVTNDGVEILTQL